MAKPIGRIWTHGNCISGYIVVGMNICVKFACEKKDGGTSWIYASKEKDKEEIQQTA